MTTLITETRGSNDRQIFDWMNSIKFKASLCQTLNLSNSKRMHPSLRYDCADRKIYETLGFFFSPREFLSILDLLSV